MTCPTSGKPAGWKRSRPATGSKKANSTSGPCFSKTPLGVRVSGIGSLSFFSVWPKPALNEQSSLPHRNRKQKRRQQTFRIFDAPAHLGLDQPRLGHCITAHGVGHGGIRLSGSNESDQPARGCWSARPALRVQDVLVRFRRTHRLQAEQGLEESEHGEGPVDRNDATIPVYYCCGDRLGQHPPIEEGKARKPALQKLLIHLTSGLTSEPRIHIPARCRPEKPGRRLLARAVLRLLLPIQHPARQHIGENTRQFSWAPYPAQRSLFRMDIPAILPLDAETI